MATFDDLAPQMPTKYLRAFFAEADIPEVTFEVTGPSGTNMIPNRVVVEHIANTRGPEAAKIGDVLRKIDFRNGDHNHFFRHLAAAVAK